MMDAPSFPPLLSGHRTDGPADPAAIAIAGAQGGTYEAGDLLWADHVERLRFALVLHPEVPRLQCTQVLFAIMVAFGDSVGALCPPETPVTYRWPSSILMNGAKIGNADLVLPDTGPADVPQWMVVSLDIQVRPDVSVPDPGQTPDDTTMWDEGCGEVTCAALLESTSRHIVHALHHWEEDGFRSIYDQWHARLDERTQFAADLGLDPSTRLSGMDEDGVAIMQGSDGPATMAIEDALAKLRRNRIS